MLGLVLLLVIGIGVGLHVGGIIDLGQLIPGLRNSAASETINPPPDALPVGARATSADKGKAGQGTAGSSGSATGAGSEPVLVRVPVEDGAANAAEDARLEEEIAQEQRDKRDLSLSAAREAMAAKRYAEARAILEPVAKLWPEHLEVNETLLEVYGKLDLKSEQAAQREVVKALRERASAKHGASP